MENSNKNSSIPTFKTYKELAEYDFDYKSMVGDKNIFDPKVVKRMVENAPKPPVEITDVDLLAINNSITSNAHIVFKKVSKEVYNELVDKVSEDRNSVCRTDKFIAYSVADKIYVCFKGEKVVLPENCCNLFSFFKAKSISFGNIDRGNIKHASYMFFNCSSMEYVDTSIFENCELESLSNMFNGCRRLLSIDLKPIDSSKADSLHGMFAKCESLETVDLSTLNTSNITSLLNTFSYCRNLKTVEFGNIDIGNVTDIENMFVDCKNLIKIDLSNLDTRKIEYYNAMFRGCTNLTSVNFSNINTLNMKKLDYMFQNCESLIKLNLSSFNTSKVTSMTGMFSGCKKLEEINMSSFNTVKVLDFAEMFYGCVSLIDTKASIASFVIQDKAKTTNILKNTRFSNITELGYKKPEVKKKGLFGIFKNKK